MKPIIITAAISATVSIFVTFHPGCNEDQIKLANAANTLATTSLSLLHGDRRGARSR